MTDRELLERAARAAGIKGRLLSFLGMEERYGLTQAIYDEDAGTYWNPLEDDGDALRLAVKLGMTVAIDNVDRQTRILNEFDAVMVVHEHFDGGPDRATCYAVVRAAAAMSDAGEEG